MPRLIDANKLKPIQVYRGDVFCEMVFMGDIENAPTVDAEPVVRCKDCRCHEGEEPGMVYCPGVVGSWMPENGFCSYGKRIEE